MTSIRAGKQRRSCADKQTRQSDNLQAFLVENDDNHDNDDQYFLVTWTFGGRVSRWHLSQSFFFFFPGYLSPSPQESLSSTPRHTASHSEPSKHFRNRPTTDTE